jgi:hydroxymethylpyrimidine/phosphomethylpyrimidine kinase
MRVEIDAAPRVPVALTIAGSDPSGGAGLQADLKTFHQRGVYGTSVVTLLTVQNTSRRDRVEPVAASLVTAQLDAVLADLPPAAAKTGALGTAAVVRAVARHAEQFRFPLVVDPVLASKHGGALADDEARAALVEALLPRAYLVTPNLDEAGALAGMEVDSTEAMEEAGRRVARLGAQAVLVKGGHLAGDAVDILVWRGEVRRFTAPRVPGTPAHGTGCTYSAAITAELAKGRPLLEAIETAKRFVTRAIETRPRLGGGYGPVNHHAEID